MILRGGVVSVSDGQTNGWTFVIVEALLRLKILLFQFQKLDLLGRNFAHQHPLLIPRLQTDR